MEVGRLAMKKLFVGAAVAALVMTYVAQGFSPAMAQAQRDAVAALPSFAEPGISPDGSTIAFVSGGDIWEVPARGGDARLLVSHPATESRPLFSPDGKRLAFTSTRTGNGDVYVLTLATGDVTRLTFDDANELVSGWSADGQSVLLPVEQPRDLGNARRLSRERGRRHADAGRRRPLHDGVLRRAGAGRATLSRSPRAPTPDRSGGAKGTAISTRARSGSSRATPRLTTRRSRKAARKTRGRCGPPAAKALYFMSDRSGAQNIWSVSSVGVQGRRGQARRR